LDEFSWSTGNFNAICLLVCFANVYAYLVYSTKIAHFGELQYVFKIDYYAIKTYYMCVLLGKH